VIFEGGAWFYCGVCDGCKKHTGEKFKKLRNFYGPLFFTSHSQRKTPPEEIQAGGFWTLFPDEKCPRDMKLRIC